MPNSDTVEAVFEQMLSLFEDGRKWRKGSRHGEEDADTYCLMDALHIASQGRSGMMRSYAWTELNQRVGQGSIVYFNDRNETTFEDIKKVLT